MAKMVTDTVEPPAQCQALMVAAPGSGHGKTVLTAALAARLVRAGFRVQIFKLGPDYLDPSILEAACGVPVFNLDRWIMGDMTIQRRLHQAALDNDVILIESLMGLFDHSPSNAQFAKRFGLPVLLVVDVAKLAQTSAAIVKGMIRYDEAVTIQSVVANRIGSPRHADLIEQSLALVTHYAGGVRRDPRLELPQRHLGLVQASELEDIDRTLQAAADCLDEAGIDLPISSIDFQPAPYNPPAALLSGVRIAIARDRAFSFIYPANLELLAELGAQCTFFSPLANEPLPDCDAVWLPGGYPELHLPTLIGNTLSIESIRTHIASGKVMLAECGGMMILGQQLTTTDQTVHNVVGVFDAAFTMQKRFQAIGPVSLTTLSGELRGHTFHHSSIETDVPAVAQVTHQSGQPGDAVYRIDGCYASYAHWYFASNAQAVARLFLGEDWIGIARSI